MHPVSGLWICLLNKVHDPFHAMDSASEKKHFNELSFYTLSHPDVKYFIHQHAVDAFQAQTAGAQTKPIALVFALIGLYLYIEKQYSGRQVQEAHVKLSAKKQAWPRHPLPELRGSINVSTVLNSEPGPQRDEFIRAWCASVWNAYQGWQSAISDLANRELRL